MTPIFKRAHDWRKMIVIPMMVTLDGLVPDPHKPPEETIGCWTCNMGFDEGKDIECPGQDLFEEEPSDSEPDRGYSPRHRRHRFGG